MKILARNHPSDAAPALAQRPAGALYRLIWRWHFFAGLVCLPVLVLMASTGALYLFKNEISDAVYASRFVPQSSLQASSLPLANVVGRVLGEHPGQLHEIVIPDEARRALTLVVTPQAGVRSVLHVDPTDARVLAIREEAWLWDVIAKRLHSMALFGDWANIVTEIVAGWCIVLMVTGTYLWWPRDKNGQKGGVLSVRGAPQQRIWWRDLHAVIGALAGSIVLFLALTGMPWSAVWGEQFGKLSAAAGLGQPDYVWKAVPQSSVPMRAQGAVPWTFEHTMVPVSGGHGRHHSAPPTAQQAGLTPPAIGLDHAAAAFAALGLHGGYTLRLPFGQEGAYTALAFPPQVENQRVIHLDQYSGKVLVEVGYADYGLVAKGVEWGIGVHTGRQYGGINQALMLLGCLAVIGLAITSVCMWWKRRPTGRLAAPPRKDADRLARGAILIAVLLGVLFPLLGLSMLAAAGLEMFLRRRWASDR